MRACGPQNRRACCRVFSRCFSPQPTRDAGALGGLSAASKEREEAAQSGGVARLFPAQSLFCPPPPALPAPAAQERLAHSQRHSHTPQNASSLPQDGRWTYSADHNTLLDGDNINNWLTVVPRDSSPEVGGAGVGGRGRGVQSRKPCSKYGGQPYMHALLRRPPQPSNTHALCGAGRQGLVAHVQSTMPNTATQPLTRALRRARRRPPRRGSGCWRRAGS